MFPSTYLYITSIFILHIYGYNSTTINVIPFILMLPQIEIKISTFYRTGKNRLIMTLLCNIKTANQKLRLQLIHKSNLKCVPICLSLAHKYIDTEQPRLQNWHIIVKITVRSRFWEIHIHFEKLKGCQNW